MYTPITVNFYYLFSRYLGVQNDPSVRVLKILNKCEDYNKTKKKCMPVRQQVDALC